MALDEDPPVGHVDFGDLRRVTPVSRSFGFDRGQPVDRYYIEGFLAAHAEDVRGCVLEVGDNNYTRRFGGERVVRSEVLSLTADNLCATIVADLADAKDVPSDTFECIIFTQTLQFIFNTGAAISTLHRILKPAGVLLATLPTVSQICRYDMDRWGDHWRFTTASVQRLLAPVFGAENISVNSYGNVLAAISFLHGLCAQELKIDELEYNDPDYQVLISARAVKGGADRPVSNSKC